MVRIGQYFTAKWRDRLAESGHQVVTAQMRKQGIPPEVAVAVLYANVPATDSDSKVWR
jgi:hypothetical protein